ncbi:MAG TPA: YciI family protein [Rhodanobacter sp.]|nr:YciI family protein [Rhodanobacter sp.]
MKYLVMIYCDSRMQGRFAKADTLRRHGQLLDAQQLEAPTSARTVRVREGRTGVVDGPFAETREYLGGFNLDAADMDEAVLIASSLPWARTGAIEVRRLRDIKMVRQRGGV